ncbi:MAG: metalloregulator ArsR/SmtB family transcription factor [Candidatus Tenebribacter davisii]|jgi:ArsR family transcriptional regulator|nr:metalloregulator ArsR/SmtB family transcription factor [Candidatus Tenebribacter davisii]
MSYSKEKYEMLSDILKATAHPVRLYILETLSEKKLCVKEFADELNFDISTISKHLTQMKNSGLIYDQREGNCVYYYIRCDCVARFLIAAKDILLTNLAREKELINK